MKDERKLIIEIEKCRYHLTLTANIKGFTHHDTIQSSQKLDDLLNQYNRMKKLNRDRSLTPRLLLD